MTVRQLHQVLTQLPPEFADCEVEFGSQLTNKEDRMMWLDQAITAIYANPDRDDVVLCSKDVGDFLAERAGNLRVHLRLIPIYQSNQSSGQQ